MNRKPIHPGFAPTAPGETAARRLLGIVALIISPGTGRNAV